MTTHRNHFLVYLAFRTQDNPGTASPCLPQQITMQTLTPFLVPCGHKIILN